MKKYFVFAAAALAALASCSKVEPEDQNGPEITFQSANYTPSTKAVPNGGSKLYKNAQFAVYGFFTPDSWATDKASYNGADENLTKAFMPKVSISYNTEKKTWAPATAYYWPKTGAISFIGFYPFDATGATIENLGNDNGATVKFENYSVTPAIATQAKTNVTVATEATNGDDGYAVAVGDILLDKNDLMVTEMIQDQKQNSNSTYYTAGVPMLFKHVLAKVNIKAAIYDPTATGTWNDAKTQVTINGITYAVTIDDVQLNDLKVSGTYSYNSTLDTPKSQWARNTTVSERTGDSGNMLITDAAEKTFGAFDRTAFTKDSESDASYATTTSPIALPSDILSQTAAAKVSNYYVMPQTLIDESTISVKYTVYIINSEGKVISAETHYTGEEHSGAQGNISLNTIGATPTTEWNENTVYTYTLNISPISTDPIYFDTCVAKWDEAEAGTANVVETK